MDIDKNELAQNYAIKSDDELLDLHSSGNITDLAYEILEAELQDRGVGIPQRLAPKPLPGEPNLLKLHWDGKARLASAYWIIGVVGSLLFLGLANIAGSSSARFFVLLAWIPYAIFAYVSIWRCAWNTRWKGWGYIARAVVILGVFRSVIFLLITVSTGEI